MPDPSPITPLPLVASDNVGSHYYITPLPQWQRWKELGCDEEGLLPVSSLRVEYPGDILMHRVIDNIPAIDDTIKFVPNSARLQ